MTARQEFEPGQAWRYPVPYPASDLRVREHKSVAARILTVIAGVVVVLVMGSFVVFPLGEDSSSSDGAVAQTPWEQIERNVAWYAANPPQAGHYYAARKLDQFDTIYGEVVQVAHDEFGRPVTINQSGTAEPMGLYWNMLEWYRRQTVDCSAQPVPVSIQRAANGGWWMISEVGPHSPLNGPESADTWYGPTPQAFALNYANIVLQTQAGTGVADVFFPADAYRITRCEGAEVAGQVAFPVQGSGAPATKWYVLDFAGSFSSRTHLGEGTEGFDELNARDFEALTGDVVTSLEGWQKFQWLPEDQ